MSGPEIMEHCEDTERLNTVYKVIYLQMCIYKNSEFTTENYTKEPNAEHEVTVERGDQHGG